jgi:glycosyltransferase involved in cell wall biosynthesis
MKVLMTADTVGGVWTYALDLMSALQPFDVQWVLATMGAPLSSEQWQQVAALPHVEVEESTFRLEWMDEPWPDVERAGEWLLQLEARHAPDVVHLNGFVHGQLPWQAPVLVVGHSCVLSWWQAVRKDALPASWATYRQQVTRGLHGAGWVVAPTQAMLDTLHHNYGRLNNAQVVYNGRDGRAFQPQSKASFIFAAGRLWDEAKNIAALDAVAHELTWPVLVAGDASHPNGGRHDSPHLRMLGRLQADELAQHMATAAIYCLPARYEPFGLSALEAGLCGCSLVLGDIPSLREVWGEAALFVEPDDPAALTRTLRRLCEDEALRHEMGKRALERAQGFTLTRMAAEYLDGYHELLQNPAREASSRDQVLWKKVLLS